MFSDVVIQDTLRKWQDAQRLYQQTADQLAHQVDTNQQTARQLQSVQPELATIDRGLQAIVERLQQDDHSTAARDETLRTARALLADARALQQRLGWEAPAAAPPGASADDAGWIGRIRHALKL